MYLYLYLYQYLYQYLYFYQNDRCESGFKREGEGQVCLTQQKCLWDFASGWICICIFIKFTLKEGRVGFKEEGEGQVCLTHQKVLLGICWQAGGLVFVFVFVFVFLSKSL